MSYDTELIRKTYARYRDIIDDYDAFVSALSHRLATTFWVHNGRVAPDDLKAMMERDGLSLRALSWTASAFAVEGDELRLGNRIEYAAGLFHIQEEASMLPVEILDPKPGERVLDLCAAPGGKTVQIALAMKNTGQVVANDRSWQRLRALRRHADRLGLANIVMTCRDGAGYPPAAGSFDRVLVDVPCSCEGTSRKNPELLGRPTDGWKTVAGLQLALLRKSLQLVKVGGRVVYSTCTYAPEENEAVVTQALESSAARLEDVRVPGFRSAPGLVAFGDSTYDPQLHKAMRVWPHHNDTGGFFVASMTRLA